MVGQTQDATGIAVEEPPKNNFEPDLFASRVVAMSDQKSVPISEKLNQELENLATEMGVDKDHLTRVALEQFIGIQSEIKKFKEDKGYSDVQTKVVLRGNDKMKENKNIASILLT